jgi:hypothetical protein
VLVEAHKRIHDERTNSTADDTGAVQANERCTQMARLSSVEGVGGGSHRSAGPPRRRQSCHRPTRPRASVATRLWDGKCVHSSAARSEAAPAQNNEQSQLARKRLRKHQPDTPAPASAAIKQLDPDMACGLAPDETVHMVGGLHGGVRASASAAGRPSKASVRCGLSHLRLPLFDAGILVCPGSGLGAPTLV